MAKYKNFGDVLKGSFKTSVLTWIVLQTGITLVGIVSQQDLTIPQFRNSRKVDLQKINSNTDLKVEDYTGFDGLSFKAPIFDKELNRDPLLSIMFPFSTVTRDKKYTKEAILNLVSFGFNSSFPKNSQADIGSLKVLSNGLSNITSPFGNKTLKRIAFDQVNSNPLGLEGGNKYNITFRAERSPEFGQYGPASLRKVEPENIKLCQESLKNVTNLVAKNAQNLQAQTVFQESCSEREFTVEEYAILLKLAPSYGITGQDNEEIAYNLVMAVNSNRVKDEQVQLILDNHRIVNSTIRLDSNGNAQYFSVSQYSVNPILNPLTVYAFVVFLTMLANSNIFSNNTRPKYSYYQLALSLKDQDINSTSNDTSSQLKESLRTLIKEMINDTLNDNDVDDRLKEILKQDKRIRFAKDTLIDPDSSWSTKYRLGMWQAYVQYRLFDRTAYIFNQILEYEVNLVKLNQSTNRPNTPTGNQTIDQKVDQVISNINLYCTEQLRDLSTNI